VELHQVRYFLAVAKTLNFTRAAEHCNVTQPALTKAVQKLEHELGGPLLLRERNLTQLTDLGKQVLPMLERTLASAEAVRTTAREFGRREVAPLRLGLSPSVSAALVLQPLADVLDHVPGLRLELCEASPEVLVAMLLNGEVNAALMDGLDASGDRIDSWTLFRERFVVLVDAEHPFAGNSEIGLEDLRGQTMLERVGHDGRDSFRQTVFEGVEPRFGHRSKHDTQLQHLAAAGFGVLISPEHMPRHPGLMAVPLRSDVAWREIHLAVVQGRRYSPALEAFVKVARLRDWSLAVRSTNLDPSRQHAPAHP
jgi:DNA-binding transcriptional LysR family regulator